jgi:SAM-dependent MidA family methyltransferase
MIVSLPIPDDESKILSDALLSLIKTEIQQNGPMSFSRFMDLALYAPSLGYYRNALKKFGKEGDFVTAPEMSPLFSQCIANQCAQVLAALQGGDILEFGAGTGTMAADILLALKEKNQLPDHYYILEISGYLKSEQHKIIAKKIPEYVDRVVWLDALPEKPIKGVVLANEVLDAMPVHQFTYQNGVKECGVTVKEDSLTACLLEKTNSSLITAIEKYDIDFSNGYTSEINLYLPGWIASIGKMLSSGLLLIMDYGFPRAEYYHPDRSMGTLMSHYRHYAHDHVLLYPGIQDITAHVDFTAVAESAVENGFDVAGFTHQAAFLMNCGLLTLPQENRDEKTRFLRNQQILQLTLPSEMGEFFKVMGLTKNSEMDLLGFQTMNQLSRL